MPLSLGQLALRSRVGHQLIGLQIDPERSLVSNAAERPFQTSCLEKGTVPKGLCLTVAAWMRYVGGVDETGESIDVRDPLAARLKQISDGAEDKVSALLKVEEVFGQDLPNDANFRAAVSAAYVQLASIGAQVAVQRYVGG